MNGTPRAVALRRLALQEDRILELWKERTAPAGPTGPAEAGLLRSANEAARTRDEPARSFEEAARSAVRALARAGGPRIATGRIGTRRIGAASIDTRLERRNRSAVAAGP